jgi:hypothetical protein
MGGRLAKLTAAFGWFFPLEQSFKGGQTTYQTRRVTNGILHYYIIRARGIRLQIIQLS